jgi:hypothetical protein
MAKAKAKAKSNTKAKKASKGVTLPNGYKVIGRAPNWDMEKHPVLDGERGEAKDVTFVDPKKKGKDAKRVVRTFIVNDETLGPVNVWESGGLRDLFDNTEDGDTVRIEYLGLGTAKKGQNPPRLFSCSKKE